MKLLEALTGATLIVASVVTLVYTAGFIWEGVSTLPLPQQFAAAIIAAGSGFGYIIRQSSS